MGEQEMGLGVWGEVYLGRPAEPRQALALQARRGIRRVGTGWLVGSAALLALADGGALRFVDVRVVKVT